MRSHGIMTNKVFATEKTRQKCVNVDAGSLAASSPLLTTKAQNGGPTIFVDGGGKEVQFKGIGW
jgi:hypothetical protein